MSRHEKTRERVRAFYRAQARGYHEQYDRERLLEAEEYPANYFRLEILCRRLAEVGARRVIDIGAGEGTPMVRFAGLGLEVAGFDLTPEMVARARENLVRHGIAPERVIEADLMAPESYRALLADGPFDAAVALGVLPHIEDERAALGHIRAVLRPGGRAFVEFRNKLFALFTLNRYTRDFVLHDLLAGVPDDIRAAEEKRLSRQLALDQPPPRLEGEGGVPGYDAILARFHNPLALAPLFEAAGFGAPLFHWYHYHPAAPFLDGREVAGRRYREAAIALEGETSGWRGMFLCSAFVAEAEAR